MSTKAVATVVSVAFICAVVARSAFGVTFGPDDFAQKGRVSYRAAPVPVPTGRPEATARIAFTCRGPVSLDGVNVLSFDGEGKVVRRTFLTPSLKMPSREIWGKPSAHAMAILPQMYDGKAEKLALEMHLVHKPKAGGEPPAFEIARAAIEWCGTPRTDRVGNWYTLGEEVVFRGSLPEGRTGLRVRVVDADGAVAFAGDVAGAEWRWKPSEVGFYTVSFDWLDAAGNGEKAVSSFTACAFGEQAGVPVRRRFAEFPRDCQCFAVSPTPARPVGAAPAMFGFNVSPSTVLGLEKDGDGDLPFELVKLLGMNSFIRFHRFAWQEIEAKGRGQYDWKSVDRTFKIAKRNGYGFDRILVNTFGTPTWLSTAPAGTKASAHNRIYSYAPRDMAPWHDYVKAFVMRYPDMRYLELWNEPHLPGYSVFWTKSSPKQFVDLMEAGYRGAKEANPDILVLMGGQGMRYQPFYEEYVKLGGVKWFDQLDTHCGYNMQHFRETERRLGAESKPYWEGEWHTVLYNCSTKDVPSEETCAYRMLTNMADLMHEGYGRITGFGLRCGNHTPESAAFFAKSEGINQVSGLFRNLPYEEPRLAALALRTATDRFSGEIERLGAWVFGEDGSQRLAAFGSEAGRMAFAWSANPRMKSGGWTKAFRAAVEGRRILDWTGREVKPSAMKAMRVYFVIEPDLTAAAKDGMKVEHLDFTTYNYKKPKNNANGRYAPLETPVWNVCTNAGVRFAADFAPDAMRFDVRSAEPLKELVVAIDATGKGLLDDVVEFRITPDGTIVKPRTPALMGDIPVDFSPAGVPLTASTAAFAHEGGETVWKVSLARGDLYPFIPAPNMTVSCALVATAASGEARWGDGWGRIKKPENFGRLRPSGGGRQIAAREAVSVKAADGKADSGLTVAAKFQPGSIVRARGVIRGNCRIHIAAWVKSAAGRGLGRVNAIGPANQRGLDATEEWKPFDWHWEMPTDAVSGDFRLFSWRDADAAFEIRDFELINE